MYYKVSALGMLTVMVVLAAAQIVYFHLFLQYQVGPSLAQKIKALLDNQVGTLFRTEAQFIKQHFQQLTEATKYYVDPLYMYFKVLVDRAAATEKRKSFRTIVQIWFFEILLFCLLGHVVLWMITGL